MMKVVALVSGGKDSCHAMLWCRAEGHEIVALANLQPSGGDELDSMMYQSVGHEAIHLYAEAMGLPLFQLHTRGKAVTQALSYEPAAGDEVEDLLALLSKVKAAHPDVQAVSSGAILSDYQRLRVENVCGRLGLVSLSYLWRRNQAELLREMVDSGMEAILVKVASFGLCPEKHLGRTLADLAPELTAMATTHQLNPCGEGGEFESLVLDCPLFRKRLEIGRRQMVMHSDDAFSPVAFLRFSELRLGEKEDRGLRLPPPQDLAALTAEAPALLADAMEARAAVPTSEDDSPADPPLLTLRAIGRDAGGDVMKATRASLGTLMTQLRARGLTVDHVAYMWVLVRDLASFADVNKAYADFFPAQHPPCRACLQVPMASEDHLLLIGCLASEDISSRSALHVQSLSHWAPANIGPYSQAISLPPYLLISGQLGMRPSDLAVVPNSAQWLLGLRHAQAIASVMPGRLALCDLAWAVCFGASAAALSEARAGFHSNVCLGECRCGHVVFARVPALPKAAAVEWQLFLRDGRGRGPTVRRCGAVQEVEAELEASRGATWLLVRADVSDRALSKAPEQAVVVPVEAFDDNAIGYVVRQ